MHLKTGFLGTPVLCRALSKCGDSETAYTLLLQEDLPSWLYEVNMGATTIWERWNAVLPDGVISGIGMNSMNHYAYGSIVEWMYRNMCGINPTEEAPDHQLRPRESGGCCRPAGRRRRKGCFAGRPVCGEAGPINTKAFRGNRSYQSREAFPQGEVSRLFAWDAIQVESWPELWYCLGLTP